VGRERAEQGYPNVADKPEQSGLSWGTGRDPRTGKNLPIILPFAGRPLNEVDHQALQEVEAQVRELNKLPLSVQTLAEAVKLISKVTKANLDVRLTEVPRAVLRIQYRREVGRYSNITVENNSYVDHYMQCADMGRLEYKNRGTEKVAWTIAGYHYPPRHYFAAIDRLRQEGKDIKKIPIQHLADAAASEENLPGSTAE
jgi:hypothetical protein